MADVKNDKDIETVGDRVKVIRKSLGLKQSDFAKRLGTVQSTLSCIERNIRPLGPDILDKLREMGYPVDWVLYGNTKGYLSTKKFGEVLKEIGVNKIHKNKKDALEIIEMLDDLTLAELQYIKGVIIGLKAANGAGGRKTKKE